MVDTRYPEFAAKLKSARIRSGKSQERIAAEVGTSRRHWIRWENGFHLPSPEFLERIGEATGQPFEVDDSQSLDEEQDLSPALLERAMQQIATNAAKQALEDHTPRRDRAIA